MPSIGIHHDNQFNAFNLADDLIEPFRPMVDMMAHHLNNTDIKLSKEDRWFMTSVLHNACEINGKIYSVANATDVMIDSLRKTVVSGDLQALLLPTISKLEKLYAVRI